MKHIIGFEGNSRTVLRFEYKPWIIDDIPDVLTQWCLDNIGPSSENSTKGSWYSRINRVFRTYDFIFKNPEDAMAFKISN